MKHTYTNTQAEAVAKCAVILALWHTLAAPTAATLALRLYNLADEALSLSGRAPAYRAKHELRLQAELQALMDAYPQIPRPLVELNLDYGGVKLYRPYNNPALACGYNVVD